MISVILLCLFFSSSFAAGENVIKIIKPYPEVEDYTQPCTKWYSEGAKDPVWKRPDNKVIGIINKENVDQYKDSLSQATYILVKEWGATLNIIPTEHNVWKTSKGYQQAQEKTQTAGGGKLTADGSLENYFGGKPFPNPKNGIEYAWNREYMYMGDRKAELFVTQVLERKGGSRVIGGGALVEMVSPRVDLDPKPEYSPNPEGIMKKEMDTSTYPPEVNGLNVLIVRYQANKDDDMWMYVPTMRRVRRFSTAQRCDSYGGSHHTYDDFWIFNGKVQSFDWKLLGEKEMYTAMQAHVNIPRRNPGGWGWTDPRVGNNLYNQDPALPGTLSPPDFKGTFKESVGKTENYLVAKRPTALIEQVAKDSRYLYSKRIVYVDKETDQYCHSECYDRKGELWKTFNYQHEIWPELVPGKGSILYLANAFAIDLIGEEGDYGGQDHSAIQNDTPPLV
jgi:hypothetical protein